ncbi:MAG: GIY-YIG nuclease family protein [Thiobacillus sp.]
MAASCWFVYLVRCADGTLYTGITTDLTRRVAEHNGESGLGARYTRSRRPVTLVYAEPATSRATAAQREAAIKRLPCARKQLLLNAYADSDSMP